METKRDLLNHFKLLQKGLTKADHAEAFLNVTTFTVEVRMGNRVYRLHPLFNTTVDGKNVYTPQFGPHVTRFGGWRPYFNRPVPDAGRKLLFKELLSKHGLPTPEYATEAPSALNEVLIKRDISSFGRELRGPFRSAKSVGLKGAEGEFYERFIPGEIVKIWFYRAKPVCLEIKPMPTVTGDGRSTIRQLAEKLRFRADNPSHWQLVEEVLAYFGRKLDDRLPDGERQLIDYRYTSAFITPQETRDMRLPAEGEKGLEVLPSVGEVIWNSLADVWRADAMYSVDAIRDPQGKLWFLEANFSPFIHPYLYPAMVRGLGRSTTFQELRFVPATA